MTIGERLKMLREQNGMTLEEVARHLGIGRSTVFRYENGTVTNIPSDKIGMLARMFDVTPSYIMGWTDEPSARRVIPIVVPDSERFVKLVHYMSTADYVLVMQAFERAEKKLKEAEDGQIHP